MQQRRTRVVATEEEIAQVAEEAVKLALQDKELIWPFIAKAQKVLPENRRRTITGRNQVNKAMVEEFCRQRQDILDTGVPFPVQITEPPKEVLVERTRPDLLASITSEEFAGLIAQRFLTPLIEMVPQLLQRGKEHTVVSAEKTPQTPNGTATVSHHSPPSAKKQRVLLFGFLRSQENDISEKSRDFNLELMMLDKDIKKVRVPPSCQWCIVFKKTSHAGSESIKTHFGDRMIVVGGVKAALSALADIHSQIVATAAH